MFKFSKFPGCRSYKYPIFGMSDVQVAKFRDFHMSKFLNLPASSLKFPGSQAPTFASFENFMASSFQVFKLCMPSFRACRFPMGKVSYRGAAPPRTTLEVVKKWDTSIWRRRFGHQATASYAVYVPLPRKNKIICLNIFIDMLMLKGPMLGGKNHLRVS